MECDNGPSLCSTDINLRLQQTRFEFFYAVFAAVLS